MSSINNSPQANSAITSPHVRFATHEAAREMTCAGSPVEAAPIPSTLVNPDGRCHHCHHQRASRRFQCAGTAEVKFSTDFQVSPVEYSYLLLYADDNCRRLEIATIHTQMPKTCLFGDRLRRAGTHLMMCSRRTLSRWWG